MNTVTDLSELRVRVVTHAAQIERLRWFQLSRYFDCGLVDELPAELPDDPTVAVSTYFGVYSDDGELQACARLITASEDLPLLGYHHLYPAAEAELRLAGDRVAEISGLAVGRNTPHHRALGLLSREFFRFGLCDQSTTSLIASIETPFVRILNQVMGIPVEIIGPEIDSYGKYNGACVPVLIDTVRYLSEARWRDTRRWDFFTEGLVIDLTDGATNSYASESELVRAS